MDKGIHYVATSSQPYVTILCLNKEYYVLPNRTGIENVYSSSSDIKGQIYFYTFDWENVTCGECLKRK